MLERQPVWRQNRKARLKPADGTLALILALLMMCGLLTLFSATYYKAVDQGDALLEVKKQLIGVGLGAFLMLLTSRIPYSFWQKPRVVMLALTGSFALLVLVLIPGIGVYVNGSRRWLNIAGLSFQPSELAKIASVMYLASTLSFRLKQVERLWTGILPLLVIPAAMFLLILQQPNLSTAGSIMIVAVLMMLLAGAKWKHLSLMGVVGLAVGFALCMGGTLSPGAAAVLPQSLRPDERRGVSAFSIPDRHRFRRPVWPGTGAGAAEVFLPALSGKRLHLCDYRRGFRPVRLLRGHSAFRGLCRGGNAYCPELSGSLRLSAGGGHYRHDLCTGLYQHRRGGGHSPNDRSSFAFFQRRRHLHFPSDGRRRHPLQYFPSCMKTLGPLRPQTLQ